MRKLILFLLLSIPITITSLFAQTESYEKITKNEKEGIEKSVDKMSEVLGLSSKQVRQMKEIRLSLLKDQKVNIHFYGKGSEQYKKRYDQFFKERGEILTSTQIIDWKAHQSANKEIRKYKQHIKITKHQHFELQKTLSELFKTLEYAAQDTSLTLDQDVVIKKRAYQRFWADKKEILSKNQSKTLREHWEESQKNKTDNKSRESRYLYINSFESEPTLLEAYTEE
ncbi:hypothetical protein MY04_4074 [Flammeovirga sp. MY04]|uniref:hypothetical protein n=1 Tax=Flammeovirga sp. MY04 TaxID=1191459 RepID=UPI0008063D25|nr:hypothetical protein [Flammeovirga sp. MY04]ANQ51418.1 hypothetical protein MY04_4074 [Flammeovirga sp. MY04]